MNNKPQQFGSLGSTGKKLEIIKLYLEMYQKTVGSLDYYNTHYVDAFAGTGQIITQNFSDRSTGGLLEDAYDIELASEIIDGSTELALNVRPSFKTYTFIELDKKKIVELKNKYSDHPLRNRIKFQCGDANQMVKRYCASMERNDRAVVFLDPFGSQVEWGTIRVIAETNKIDLWYLFPSGVGVYRQISKDGNIDATHEPSINRLYGTSEWKTAFIKSKPAPNLFDLHATENEKLVNPAVAADYMISRMNTVFKGGVNDEKIELGKHSYPSFHLLFAWGNPSQGATSLARRLSLAAINASGKE